MRALAGLAVLTRFLDNTGFNAATAVSPQYVQNSATYGAWSVSFTDEVFAQIGTTAGGNAGESNLFNKDGGVFYGRINSLSGGAASVAQSMTNGLSATERTSSTSTTLYSNGSSSGGKSDTSTTPENVDFVIGKVPPQTHGTVQTLSAAFMRRFAGQRWAACPLHPPSHVSHSCRSPIMPSSYGVGAWGEGLYSRVVTAPVSPWAPSTPCPPAPWEASDPCPLPSWGPTDPALAVDWVEASDG